MSAVAEEWRAVAMAPAYAISDWGRIKRIARARTRRSGTFLTPSPRRKPGYLRVTLRIGGRGRGVFVHRLVCEAFHGPPPTPEHEVAHFDGDGANNCADNLRWATRLENAADKQRHGRVPKGERHPARCGQQRIVRGDAHWSRAKTDLVGRGEAVGTAKLSDAQVREIRTTPAFYGVTVQLSKQYGVSDVLIGRIRRGLQWKHVDA